MISFFGCAREYKENMWRYLQIAERVLGSGQVLQGSEVTRLETTLSNHLNRTVVCTGSCTDALFFALKLLGLKPGDKVIVPAFSFVASASCILRAGLEPVFVDVDDWGNLKLSQVEVKSQVRAIVFVHMYGRMVNPTEIWEFSQVNNLFLIEDAAQAFGGSYGDVKAGQVGNLACFSFDPTKNLSAPGSGGAITVPETWRLYAEDLRYHGKHFSALGYNSQLSELSAAFINFKLTAFSTCQKRRNDIAMYYIDRLSHLPISLPRISTNVVHTWHKFIIRYPARDALKKYLLDRDIQTKIHYETPLHRLPLFSSFEANCPNADTLSKEVLSLPIHPYLSDAEVETVVDAIRASFV